MLEVYTDAMPCVVVLLARKRMNCWVPNVISYKSPLSACEKCGQWQHALGLLVLSLEMQHNHWLPNVISYISSKNAKEKRVGRIPPTAYCDATQKSATERYHRQIRHQRL